MKVLYFDCSSGISGDMVMSAFIDLGIDKEKLISELEKLNLDGWELEAKTVFKSGIKALSVDVKLTDCQIISDGDTQMRKERGSSNELHKHSHIPEILKRVNRLFDLKVSHNHDHNHGHGHGHSHSEEGSHCHRNMSDIRQMIERSGISQGAKALALRIFTRVAEAEAEVHGTTPDKVHFHEVGAVDSIIDIVGAAICMDIIKPDKVYCSVLKDGYGFVKCRHGKIPVPVPAVVGILSAAGVALGQSGLEGEMITPTGAAIVAEIASEFGNMPQMKIEGTGYGAGKKDFEIPNILRLFCGTCSLSDMSQGVDNLLVIESNIDDSSPEVMAYAMDRLMAAGARDVFFTPIYMKKNRPAVKISIIADDGLREEMETILFSETNTIGIRWYPVSRSCLERWPIAFTTRWGEIKAKEVVFNGRASVYPEYDDACRVAKENNVPLKDIYREVK